MKKSILVILSAVLMLNVNNLFAQEQQDLKIKEPGRTEFEKHWFMQIQAGAAHTIGETKFSDLISPAAAINLGYQFNPVFALRLGASGWQAKGSWVASPKAVYKYKYLQGNVDAMFNLSNLFCKFNPERIVDFYGFLGVGLNRGFDNDEAIALAAQGAEMQYLWTKGKILPVARGGLGMNVRLSDRVALNIEGNANTLSDKFNSKKAGNTDWQFNALIGLNIKFGKGYKKIAPVYYEPEPQPQPKQEAKPEPKPEPKPEVVKVEAMTQNIFFDINKSVVRADQEAKIAELVSYLNKYPNAKVVITGYADKKTGNASVNDRLSKQRSEAVANALQAKGISADRISTNYKGDTVQPFSVNEENRVSICVAE